MPFKEAVYNHIGNSNCSIGRKADNRLEHIGLKFRVGFIEPRRISWVDKYWHIQALCFREEIVKNPLMRQSPRIVGLNSHALQMQCGNGPCQFFYAKLRIRSQRD